MGNIIVGIIYPIVVFYDLNVFFGLKTMGTFWVYGRSFPGPECDL